jgi:hypothetical protein
MQLAFRRLLKRDTTTKMRALSELDAAFADLPDAQVAPCVTVWAAAYGKLCNDVDRNVRTQANISMLTLAKRAGRELAPQLKLLLPPMLVSQYDQAPEVADAARKAFEVAFVTPVKRTNALAFAADALAEHVRDTIEQFYNECGGMERALANAETPPSADDTQSLAVQVACDLRVAELSVRTLGAPGADAAAAAAIKRWDDFFGVDASAESSSSSAEESADDERWRLTLWPLLNARARPLAAAALALLSALCTVRSDVVERHLRLAATPGARERERARGVSCL